MWKLEDHKTILNKIAIVDENLPTTTSDNIAAMHGPGWRIRSTLLNTHELTFLMYRNNSIHMDILPMTWQFWDYCLPTKIQQRERL